MSTAIARPILTMPPEVQVFARKRGLEPYLPGIVEVFLRIFDEGRKRSVMVHHDPEVEGLSWLLFEVEVPWPTFEQARQADIEWYQETAALCPAPLLCEFSLIIRRRVP
jgi:hypothetical protein